MRSLFARIPLAVRLAGGYVVCAVLGIVLGHGAVARFFVDLGHDWLKGLEFVGSTSLVLYLVSHRVITHIEATRAALHASDERWKFALEGAGDGVWDWDGETRKVYYSARWKAMLGYAEAEVGDGTAEWESRIHPDDRERVRQQFRLHYLGRTAAFDCELRLRTREGSYKWVLNRGKIVRRSPKGRPLRVIGTQSDISERKEAEARVANALILSETIVRAAPVAILTYRADGQALSANEAAGEFLGGSVPSLLQANFRQLESWRRHGLVPIADRALQENEVISRPTRFISTYGRDRWGELTFAPFTHDGEQRLLLIIQDTTMQHAALERLELLHAALDAAPTAWVVTDSKGIIEWVNPGFTKLTGYAANEAVGCKPNFLKSGRHSAEFYANFWATIRAGQVWRGEMCNRHKSGSLYYERTTVAPVRDAGGAITHYVAMKEDITGEHDLERQLARSQRLQSIGLIASGIAHDLNNVLTPILLAVSIIKESHTDRETVEVLDMMQGAAKRGATIVQQVLTFARGVDGERMQLDVRPLLKEIAQLIRETFPRTIKIVVETAPVPLLVDGDVTPLHQVLLNLAVNARDAMSDGGLLTLKAEAAELDAAGARAAPGGKSGNYVKLTVADSGIGIPPEVMEHIFEPFFTTKPRGKGTGLGLSSVYGIVRSLGGFVDVASEVGRGTAFSVLLPVSSTAKKAAPTRSETAPPIAGAGRRVLVVDDEQSIRVMLSHLLGNRGFVAVLAEDGIRGLECLREGPDRYNAAIVDLMMPGMSGYKLIPEIRQLAPNLPIVVASGMMGQTEAGEDRAALMALGVRAILKKPFAEAELVKALSSLET